MKLLVFLVILNFSMLVFADGGSDAGNGGGVICVNGVCKTLTEAGLRLSPEFNGVWIPTTDHYRQVEYRIDKTVTLSTPTRNLLLQRVFARSDHFRRVDVVDPNKLEQIKAIYMQVALDAGLVFDPQKFRIVAFSSDNTAEEPQTFLLPEFFNLTKKQQAEMLIHEGLYRAQTTQSLKAILQFESSMAEIDSKNLAYYPWACDEIEVRICLNQNIIGYRLGLINKADLIMALLEIPALKADKVEPRYGVIDFAKFATMTGDSSTLNVELNPIELTKLGKVDSRIPYIFSKASVLKFSLTVVDFSLNNPYRYGLFYSWDQNISGIMQRKNQTDWTQNVFFLSNADQIILNLPE